MFCRTQTVYRLKEEFGESLSVTLNGGVQTSEEVFRHLWAVDGVMIGRAISSNPFLLRELDSALPQSRWAEERRRVVEQCMSFTANLEQTTDCPQRHVAMLLRPLHNLLHNTPAANAWRRTLYDAVSSDWATAAIQECLRLCDAHEHAAVHPSPSAKEDLLRLKKSS
jgi:tRNA-dihydrouridine synthase